MFDWMKEPADIGSIWELSKSKSANEAHVVTTLLNTLSISTDTIKVIENNDPPDCTINLEGRVIGIEVVGLVDERARQLDVNARRKNKNGYYAEWTEVSFQERIIKIVKNKATKIKKGIDDGKVAITCDDFWLVIHVDEMTLYSLAVSEFLKHLKVNSEMFASIYLILAYEPGRSDDGYPIFQLNS